MCAADAWAQDFRCIVPDEDRFYMDSGRMLGLRVIDIETVNGATVYHFNHDLRPAGFNDPSGCNTASSCDEMEGDAVFTGNGASWMGTHMLERPDGYNLFFNFLGDTIRVNTLANEGESWTVFNWGDSLQLIATITSIDGQTVNGTLQDVKTISFQAVDSVGNPTDHPMNSQQWQLGQHDGFVRVHSLYWFPDFQEAISQDAYQCFFVPYDYGHEHHSSTIIELTDYNPPTYGRMFRMNVGDEFQYRRISDTWSGESWRYRRYKVEDKIHSDNSVEVILSEETINVNTEQVSLDTISITISDTTAIFPNGLLPNIMDEWTALRYQPSGFPDISNPTGNGQNILEELYSTCQLTTIEAIQVHNVGNLGGHCYAFYSQADGTYGPEYFISGLPYSVWHQGGISGGYEQVIIYINTSTCQFGSRMYVGVEEISSKALNIHPNPASTILRFDSPSPTAYTVIDAVGRTVMQGQAQQGQNTLSVDGLPQGIYILRLDDGRGAARFVKAGH
jgi:hypothetical protein